MQITIEQSELEQAIRAYLATNGITQSIGEMNFTASRGAAGIITEVEITSSDDADTKSKKTPSRRKTTPPADAEVVDATSEEEGPTDPVEEEEEKATDDVTDSSLFS